MIHINNLAFILQSGELRCPAHLDHDPNYTPIGDESLIQKRGTKTVPQPPGGSFLNYISFYFGNRSPMLYKIQKENNEVPTIPQEEIIYLVTTVHNVTKHTDQFVFFDGHGFESLTRCFNSLDDLKEVDMEAVGAKWWSSVTDPDLMRRKQAEFLVKNSLPLNYLKGIAVYNKKAENQVKSLLSEYNVELPLKIKKDYYY